jgi:pilus assembly protein CpaE
MTEAILPFIAFAADNDDLNVLGEFASAQGFDAGCVHKGTIREAINYLKKHASPEVLLVELPSQEEAAELLDALADVVAPGTKVITIGMVNEYSFYCWLTDIGIFAYLLRPLSVNAVEAAYLKSKVSTANVKSDKPPAKLIAVMGARGGVGASTVAINLASIIAEQTKKQTALIDLDPQEGSIALALDIEPCRGFRDVLEKPDRIDSLFLDRVMGKIGKYLSVMSAEEAIADKLVMNENAAQPLLAELRAKYDYVILDVPRHLTQFSHACMIKADFSVLVVEMTLLSLRDTLRMQEAMHGAWKMKPPVVVANKVGFAKGQEVPVVDFEKGTHCKIVAQVPFVPDIFMPMEQETAAQKNKTHAALRPLYDLAATLVPQAKLVQTQASKAGFSLFKKKE